MKNKGFSVLISICFLAMLFLPGLVKTAWAEDDTSAGSQDEQLPLLLPYGPDYRTPRAGEGFRAEVFGREIKVNPRDGRSVSSVDIGLALYKPLPEDRQVVPFGALYIWRHPNDEDLFRGVIAGVYDDIFWAHTSRTMEPFELVATFNNYTLPFAQYELVDGIAV